MSEEASKPQNNREAAMREWEQQTHSSLVADQRKKITRAASSILITALAGTALGIAWYVKHNTSGETKPVAGPELAIAERKPVPKLKEMTAASVPAVEPTAPAETPVATPADDPLKIQREQMEMQRLEQEQRLREARLKSAIMPSNASSQPTASVEQAVEAGEQGQAGLGTLNMGSEERGTQDSNSRFARSVSGNGIAVSRASQIDHLEYRILQGKLIEAVLEPRAISDLPGMICATVQRDVYGAQGRNKLIPWGSRLCGVYSAELRKGQNRLFAVWNTVRRPDGVQVTLDSIGADQLGTAGMGGFVDTHFAEIFGMSALLSIIGAGASNVGVDSGDQQNSAAYYRQSVQQAAAQTSQQVLQPYVNIAPTITVPAGSRIRVYVNRDLDFTPVYKDDIDAAKQGFTLIQ